MNITIIHTSALTPHDTDMITGAIPGDLEPCGDFLRLHHARAVNKEARDHLRATLPFDVNPLPEKFDRANTRLLVTDMDSTLINIECIDEIADFTGLKPQVSAITEAAMRGEIDFETSLTRRVGLLKGLAADALQRVYDERLRPNPGAERMLACLKQRAIKTAVVSGGFTFFTERLKARLGLDYAHANVLDMGQGLLTGRVVGGIVGAAAKAEYLSILCTDLGIDHEQAIAMGDGANDLLMMERAGLGIAYRAKPKVQAQADVVLNHSTLAAVCHFL